MSVADKITRLTTARNDIRTALNNKGADASEHGFEDFAEDINGLSGGGSLPSLDNIAFGNNPTVPEDGKTASANYEAIAQAIDTVAARTKTFTLDSLTVEEGGTYTPPSGTAYDEVNVNVLSGTPITLDDEDDDEWVRPNGWPDLDNLELEDDFEGVYLTYDLTKTVGYGWIGLWISTSNNATYSIERGHLENSIFIADETFSVTNSGNYYFRQDLNQAQGDIQLWKVSISSGHITNFGFVPNESPKLFANNLQPCVERYAKLPYWSGWYSNPGTTSSTTACFSTAWLESDVTEIGQFANVKNMRGMWQKSYNLQRLDVSKWNTNNWQVTDLSYTWETCYKLKKLDLSAWNTSNWAVQSLTYTWSACKLLKELNISNWDTSNWVVGGFSCWNGCTNLKALNISNWDVSNWQVTQLLYTWNECYCLKELDLSNWDVSNWPVNAMNYTWRFCRSLSKLLINNWDVSNWPLTSLNSTWYYCSSLRSLDLSKWNTSNWAVKNFGSVWSDMYVIEHLNISSWNTSNWAVLYFNYPWAACYNLKELDISNWNTSNWAVLEFTGPWKDCYNLKELDISNWNTSNWAVKNLNMCWQGCWSLKELDVSSWNTSNWVVQNINTMFHSCYCLKTIDLSNWDASNWNITSGGSETFRDCFNLHTLLMPSNFDLKTNAPPNFQNFLYNLRTFSGIKANYNLNFSTLILLTKQSLLNIIDKLPTITAKKTLNLGATNKLKLTAEEIAVATEKGWTVA